MPPQPLCMHLQNLSLSDVVDKSRSGPAWMSYCTLADAEPFPAFHVRQSLKQKVSNVVLEGRPESDGRQALGTCFDRRRDPHIAYEELCLQLTATQLVWIPGPASGAGESE